MVVDPCQVSECLSKTSRHEPWCRPHCDRSSTVQGSTPGRLMGSSWLIPSRWQALTTCQMPGNVPSLGLSRSSHWNSGCTQSNLNNHHKKSVLKSFSLNNKPTFLEYFTQINQELNQDTTETEVPTNLLSIVSECALSFH